MKLRFTRILAISAIAIPLAACNRNQTQTPAAPEQAAPATATPTPAQPPPPAPLPPATELPLNTVDSVMLSRDQDEPMAIIIRVSGTALSPGWTNPKLTEEADSGGSAETKTYKFVATSPEMPSQDRTTQPIEAEIRIDSLAPEVKTIRIVSASNEVSAPIAH